MSAVSIIIGLSFKLVKRFISGHIEGSSYIFDAAENALKIRKLSQKEEEKNSSGENDKSKTIFVTPENTDQIINQIKFSVGTIYHQNVTDIGLDIFENRVNIKKRVLRELLRNPEAKIANQWLMLCYLDRFKFKNTMDDFFVEEGINIVKKTPSLQLFTPSFLHRKADLELRVYSGQKGIYDSFNEIAERYLHLSNTHGYYDCLRQEAHAKIQESKFDEAYSILLNAYNGLLSSDYKNNDLIDRLPMDSRVGFIANTICSFARLWRAEGNFQDALIALKYGRFLYNAIGQDHGVANTSMDIGLIERHKGVEFYHEGNLWLQSAARKFRILGDDFRAKECLSITEGILKL